MVTYNCTPVTVNVHTFHVAEVFPTIVCATVAICVNDVVPALGTHDPVIVVEDVLRNTPVLGMVCVYVPVRSVVACKVIAQELRVPALSEHEKVLVQIVPVKLPVRL